MAYQRLPVRTSQDLYLAADINLLQSNFDSLIGGSIPSTSLNNLYDYSAYLNNKIDTEVIDRVNADNALTTRIISLENSLPVGGIANQIFKNNGGGSGVWGTVTESSGALANITNITMSRQITTTLPTGTPPFIISSTTQVDNLNVDMVDGKHATDFVYAVEKGAPSGVATLTSSGVLEVSQLPLLSITDTFIVSSEILMLGLSAEKGDVAIRTDISKTFILADNPASILSNWKEIITPTGSVYSVDSRVGYVTLTDLYAPLNKGVTNGDTHDHHGGDGGQIALANLSGIDLTGLNDTNILKYDSISGNFLPTTDISSNNFIVQTPDASLPNAQALSDISTGILKTSTGILYKATAGVDYLLPNGDGSQLVNVDALPDQTAQDGKYLYTSSGVAYWVSVYVTSTGQLGFGITGLPSQTGQDHKFLSTSSGTAYWTNLPTKNLTTSTGLSITGGTNSVIGSDVTIGIATGRYLPTTADETTWNSKQDALTFGNLLTSTGLSISGGTGSIIGSDVTVGVASGQYLPTTADQTNWNDAYSKEHVHSNISNLNSINQDLATTSAPSFTGLNVGTSTGIMKADSGFLSIAVPGIDYLLPDGDGSQLTGVDRFPDQTGQDGKVLATSSGNVYWRSSTIVTGDLTTSTGLTVIGGTDAVFGSGAKIGISSGRYLPTTSDQSNWDGKENALTKGNLTASLPILVSGGNNAVIGSGVSVSIGNATLTSSGVVQLSNSYYGILEDVAVTEKALSDGLASSGEKTGVDTIFPAETKNVDLLDTSTSNSCRWILKIYIPGGRMRLSEILSQVLSGNVISSEYAIIGSSFLADINVILDGSNLALQIKNNESEAIRISYKRLFI
jgi:hypothetical protein